ncbi:hypothetical protein [Methylobacterium marchantiae]|uniref:Uncharacterized protein n=1 Tax=Methylobacterium marchantiae TaxID=600331 RepID=A0ABW3X0T3_9HYPH
MPGAGSASPAASAARGERPGCPAGARAGAIGRLPLDSIRPGLALMRLVIAEATGYQALDPASPDGRL